MTTTLSSLTSDLGQMPFTSLPDGKKAQQSAFDLALAQATASNSAGDTASLSSTATGNSLAAAVGLSSDATSSSGIPHYTGYTSEQDQQAAMWLSGAYDKNPDGSGKLITAVNTLTAGDKALVKQAFGYDIDSDPLGSNVPKGAEDLIGRLNMDRYNGDLTGPVTASYLQGLATQTHGAIVPLPEVEKAEQALNQISLADTYQS
jgi:hypothetical protein